VKVIWEPADVQAGLLVNKPPEKSNCIIGVATGVAQEGRRWTIYHLCSSQESQEKLSKDDVVRILNEGGYMPVGWKG
jgi:hypothetical protein